jgi:16S rRNA (uracil1498-N3)-methyltransferase
MKRFCLSHNSIIDNLATIEGEDVHHIKNVLRLKKEDILKLVLPDGQSYQARIDKITNKQILAEIVKPDQTIIQPTTHVTIAQSLLKEKKLDKLIRQATELGISRWITFVSERSASRPDASRMKQKVRRWHKIAQSAAQQCNGLIPDIHDQLVDINEIISLCTENQPGYFFWEKSDNNLSPLQMNPLPKSIILVFGPEGGFSDNEAGCARKAGFIISSLGPRILRAETATITGLALIQYFFNNFRIQ